MYDRIRIVTSADSDHEVIKMFAKAFDNIKKHQPWKVRSLPTVVSP